MARKQTTIPGTGTKAIVELDQAAEAYVDARDKRMKHTEKEVEAHEALVACMKKHRLSVYRDDDASPPLVVTLTVGKDRVKVHRADDNDEEAAA